MTRRDSVVRTIVDPAAELVPAARRVFGADVRVLDGSRSLLVGELKLSLEGGERELWLIEMHGALEHRLSMVEVAGDIEAALSEAKARIDGD
jgi:hypothetical protein